MQLVILIGVVFCVFRAQDAYGGATEEQMWAAGKLMRDVCQPKFPSVTNAIADNIKAGIITEDKDQKCYINCILEMMQIIKKGKFLYESALKQVDVLMPDTYKEEYHAGLGSCKGAAVGIKNPCDSAYALLTCFRAQITRFVFP